MGRLNEWIAWNLNKFFPPLAIHRELETAKRSIEANREWAYEEAKKISFAFGPFWDLRNKDVLDIGGGFGGKMPYYLEQEVNSLVEADIDYLSVKISSQYLNKFYDTNSNLSRIDLTVTDAANLPFIQKSFDVIIGINVFEHIKNIEAALQETYRVLRPGGLAFIHLPPYYGPWGPHLENWIHFPWPHLLFSEKTLMRVAARVDHEKNLSNQFIQPAHKIDWPVAGDRIPDVNHVTLKRFRRLIKKTGFCILHLKLLPVGYNILNQNPTLKRNIIYWLLDLSTKLPLIQEITVTKMVYVLKRLPDYE